VHSREQLFWKYGLGRKKTKNEEEEDIKYGKLLAMEAARGMSSAF